MDTSPFNSGSRTLMRGFLVQNKKKYIAPVLVKQGTIIDLTKGTKRIMSPNDGWMLEDDDLQTVVS
jgi:hypothetical protein